MKSIKADPTGLDASPEALIELNKQGASKEIMDAVAGAQLRNPTPATPAVVPQVGQMPDFNQVVVVIGNQRVPLQLGNGKTSSTFIPFAPSKTYMKFDGKNSPLRINGSDLSIEFFAMGNVRVQEKVALLRPAVKRNHRSVEIGKVSGFFVHQTSQGDKDVVPADFAEISSNSFPGVNMKKYRLTPKKPIGPGEYVLMKDGVQWYDFGVDAN